jgi:hypothetical protein
MEDLNLDLMEVEELESKIAPDSGMWDMVGD